MDAGLDRICSTNRRDDAVAGESHHGQRFAPGDRVRVDIPDETHPDHRRQHSRHGQVIAIIPDDESVPDTQRKYRVAFDDGGYADFPFWHLRPPIVV